jgi:hypothetical protein
VHSRCSAAEPSPPSLPPCAGPHCPHAMRGYKRRPLPFVCPRPHRCLPSVSRPGRALPLFSATSSVPSHLTPPLSPYAGPRASPEPRAAPQPEGPTPSPPLSSGAVDRAGEFRPSVARLPRCELGLSIVSGEYTVGWGSLRCTSCRGLAAGEPCHGTRSERAASCGRPSRLWAALPRPVRPYGRAVAGRARAVCVAELGFGPEAV